MLTAEPDAVPALVDPQPGGAPTGTEGTPARAGRSRPTIGRLLSWTWLLLVLGGAATVAWLPLAEGSDPSKALTEPIAARPDLLSGHPLGTDRQGLDLLAQSLEGARVSLTIGIGAVVLAGVLGGALGILAGFLRGRWEQGVQILTDALLAYPPLILLLAIVTALNPSTPSIAGALALVVLPTYARLARAATLRIGQQEFVLAARACGATTHRILWREIAPSVAVPVISYSFAVGAGLIVAEASLSFLGLGIQRPTPTWGNMIAAGQVDFQRDPHLVLIPGLVLFLTVFALNHVGEGLRTKLDPRESNL